MSYYTNMVAQACNIPPQRARLAVGYLLLDHGTLGAISGEQIAREYRSEISRTIDADPSMADRLAKSYGL